MTARNFDDILEEVGPSGRYQFLVIVLVGLAHIPIGGNTLANVFLAGLPVYHCVDGDTQLKDDVHSYTGQNKTAIYSHIGYENGSKFSGENFDYNVTLTHESKEGNECYVSDGNSSRECTKWIYETHVYSSTIATKWDLVCGQEWKLAVSQSAYMLGFLIGAIVYGNLSDIFGRKRMWLVAMTLMGLSSVVTSFMPNYWTFILGRLVVGMSAVGAGACGYVLLTEVLGPKHRMIPSIMYQGWFAVGYMGLAVLAYFVGDYVYLQLIIGIVTLLHLPFWFILGESPRWMLIKGFHNDAKSEIQRMARMNKTSVPTNLLDNELTTLSKENNNESVKVEHLTVAVLLKTRKMRSITINVWFQWMVVSMIYYGLSLGVSDLVGGPHLNLFLSGLVEFPGFFLAILIMDRIGRRWSVSLLNMIGGVACIAMAIIPQPELFKQYSSPRSSK